MSQGGLKMNWKKASNIFILLPLITVVSGNFSLGPVVAGLTGLTWGIGPGSLFIGITTVLLLILTGNINMELIFLYLWSLAYLIQAGYVLGSGKKKTAYFLMAFLSLLMTPVWRLLLGLVPVKLLNELNIAGGLLTIAGLLIFLIRFRLLLKSKASNKEIFESLLVLLCSLTGLMGSFLTLPLWLGGTYLINLFTKNQWEFKSFLFQKDRLYFVLSLLVIFMTTYAASLLLPYGIFSALLLFAILFLFFRQPGKVPAFELVYFSMILGILASRMGILL
jgi:hypothetical protein